MAFSIDTAGTVLDQQVSIPAHVVYREFVQEMIILNLETGLYHSLNRTGGEMLKALEQAPSLKAAAATLARLYPDAGDLTHDLARFCTDLAGARSDRRRVTATGVDATVAPVASRPAGIRRGVYGMVLPDLRDAADLLVPAPSSWSDWSVAYEPGMASPDFAEELTDERARLLISGGGWVEIERERAACTLHLPAAPSAREIVHPFLGLAAATAARWRGWDTFHAAGVVVDGRVWGLVGDKGVGKTTTMAQLATWGMPVMADDMLVVAEGHVLAGPRCLDFREATATHFSGGEPLGLVGARTRWRAPLESVPWRLPLGGFVRLAWGDSASVTAVPPGERVPLLASSFTLRVPPPSWKSILEISSLPTLHFARPPELESLAVSVELLVSRLAAA